MNPRARRLRRLRRESFRRAWRSRAKPEPVVTWRVDGAPSFTTAVSVDPEGGIKPLRWAPGTVKLFVGGVEVKCDFASFEAEE